MAFSLMLTITKKKLDIEKPFINNSSQLDENINKSQCWISALSTNPVQRQELTIVELIIQWIKYLGILTWAKIHPQSAIIKMLVIGL